MSTNVVLIMVLMGIAIICLGALSLDYHRKISILRNDVKRLESTQILLMVPDEQAEAIANWLASHPDQTKAMLKLAKPGEQNAVTLGPEVAPAKVEVPPLLDKTPAVDKSAEQSQPQAPLAPQLPQVEALPSSPSNTNTDPGNIPVVISENADGVKVISLPNGGIRVTTREGE